MNNVHYRIVRYCTLPGVVMHEWSHKTMCKVFGIPVVKTAYATLDREEMGYVVHAEPKTYISALMVSMGPLIINSPVAFFMVRTSTRISHSSFVFYILIWIAFSIGVHAIPSDKDIQNIFSATKHPKGILGFILGIVLLPFIGIVFCADKMKKYWFDVLYALCIVCFAYFI
jgi:Putative zincin peptidase